MALDLPQIDIVTGILGVIAKRPGGKNYEPTARQMNAIIEAANLIVDAFAVGPVRAVPGMGLRSWLASDDTGLSSQYLAHVLAPLAGLGECRVPDHVRQPHPWDAADFGRCIRLLDAVPELRPHLPVLASGHGPAWAKLVGAWAELEAIYRTEAAGTNTSRQLYRRVRSLVG